MKSHVLEGTPASANAVSQTQNCNQESEEGKDPSHDGSGPVKSFECGEFFNSGMEDVVKIQLDEGEVIRIGIRATTLRLYDASELIVPNSDIVSQKVINWTLANRQRRLHFEFVLPIQDLDPTRVVYLVEDAMKNITQSADLPAPAVYYDGVEDNKARFYIHFWVEREILFTKNQVYTDVFNTLRLHGIGMIVPEAISLKQVDEHAFQEEAAKKEVPAEKQEAESKEDDVTPDPSAEKQA